MATTTGRCATSTPILNADYLSSDRAPGAGVVLLWIARIKVKRGLTISHRWKTVIAGAGQRRECSGAAVSPYGQPCGDFPRAYIQRDIHQTTAPSDYRARGA
jgi:hypothetical protein